MREEFPSLARFQLPTVSREPLAWAFLSGIGAGPIVGGIVRVALLWAGPILLPQTQPHPAWLDLSSIALAAAAVATGAVLMRAGGIAAIGAYLVYELARLLEGLPGRQAYCANAPPALPAWMVGCDYTALVVEHWVTWGGLVVGILAALAFLRGGTGENRLLRASGAFSLVLVVVSVLVAIAFTPARADQQSALLAVFTTTNVVAGVVAGVLLARHRLAAAVLLAALIVGPGMAFALPNALGPPGGPESVATTMVRWAGVYIPLAAAAALLLSRAFVRMGPREGGTFS